MAIPTPIGEFGQFGSGSTERADFGGDFVGFAIAVLISAKSNLFRGGFQSFRVLHERVPQNGIIQQDFWHS